MADSIQSGTGWGAALPLAAARPSDKAVVAAGPVDPAGAGGAGANVVSEDAGGGFVALT